MIFFGTNWPPTAALPAQPVTATRFENVGGHPRAGSWRCHRCGRINAPWKSSCDCTNTASPSRPFGDWEQALMDEPCLIEAAQRANPHVHVWHIACPCPKCRLSF
jgi:hypothetical protein